MAFCSKSDDVSAHFISMAEKTLDGVTFRCNEKGTLLLGGSLSHTNTRLPCSCSSSVSPGVCMVIQYVVVSVKYVLMGHKCRVKGHLCLLLHRLLPFK